MIFPEINYDEIESIHGMDITFVTSTNRDDDAYALLQGAGHAVPFGRQEGRKSDVAARTRRRGNAKRRAVASDQ